MCILWLNMANIILRTCMFSWQCLESSTLLFRALQSGTYLKSYNGCFHTVSCFSLFCQRVIMLPWAEYYTRHWGTINSVISQHWLKMGPWAHLLKRRCSSLERRWIKRVIADSSQTIEYTIKLSVLLTGSLSRSLGPTTMRGLRKLRTIWTRER